MTDHVNETIIDFVDSEDTCHVYTHKATWQRYFASQGIKPSLTAECGAMEFDIPKKWLLMPKNRSKRAVRLVGGSKKQPSFV